MNIILKYILHNIWERKQRTLVMLLSIVLSTTLLFVSLSIGDSYAEAQRKMARGMAGNATLSVTSSIPEKWIAQDSVPKSASIKHAVGIVNAMALYKEDGYYENFDLIAADLDELQTINAPRLLGGAQLDDFSGNQIVLPDRFTSKFGVEPGDTITLWLEGEPYVFTVAAIAVYDTVFLRHTRGTNALVPLDTLQSILGAGGAYSQILIEPAEKTTTVALQASLREKLPDSFAVSRIVNEAQVEASAQQKSMPFYLISFFSLTMSVFIIFSSYKVITLERLPVIGTFRSIGATEETVTRILMLESLVYGGLGALLGIAVGFGALRLLLTGLGDSLSQGIEIPMIVAPLNILIACGVAVIVSVLSAWIPVKRASQLPVKEVVLGHVEEQTVSNQRLFLIGAGLLAASIILPQLGRLLGSGMLLLLGGFSLLGLLAATIIVIPMAANGASYVLERVYGFLFGNVGRLSARNLRDNKNISQNITLLFISISAVIAITVVGSFVQVYIGDVFRGAKLDGFTDATMSPAFVEEIKEVDGIDEVLPVRVMNNMMQIRGMTLSRVEGTDDIAKYREMFAMTYGREQDRAHIESTFSAGRNMLLSAESIQALGVKVGDTVTVSSGGREFQYTVMGSFKIRSTNTAAIIPEACATADFGAQNYGIVAYTAADPDAVMVQIRDLFGEKDHWSRTVEEFNADAMGTVNAFLEPMQNLTWFILILATVGIMNNLLINHIQRRRATAMYKSVGLNNAQNMKMVLLEGLSAGSLGALIAMAVSWLEIKTIFLVAGPRIFMYPELEPGTFLLAGALGLGITLIGSILPMIQNRRMKIVEELKFD